METKEAKEVVEGMHRKVVGFNLDPRQYPESLDGSYVTDKGIIDHSLVSDSSLSSDVPNTSFEHAQRESMPFPKINNTMEIEEEDEDESFIRSPIGGGKKSTPHILSVGAPCTPFPQLQSGQVKSGLRAISSTSTPGMVLTATPGQLTPILASDSTPAFPPSMDNTGVTPFLKVNYGQERSILPDASFVFGIQVCPRPIPGQATNWPTKAEDLVQKVCFIVSSDRGMGCIPCGLIHKLC